MESDANPVVHSPFLILVNAFPQYLPNLSSTHWPHIPQPEIFGLGATAGI